MSDERFEKGLKIRREVMGDGFVDRAFARANEFDMPFQEFVTRVAWGEAWGREGLDRRTKSMLTLAMLVALNRGVEFKGHVRGALRNGVTIDEIRDLLVHSAIYCGMPAAVSAFRDAREVLDELGAEEAIANK